MCCRRRVEISWTDRVRNEGITKSQGPEEYRTYSKKEEMLTIFVTSCVETTF